MSDQQKINKFARLNNRLEDLKEDLKSKKNELQTLEDAGTDLMMLEDDDEKVHSLTAFVIMIRCEIPTKNGDPSVL